MRILYVAEIVGRPGLHCVKSALRDVRKDREIDFVVANGDAVTGGFGLGKNHSVYLRKLGVDVITGGDQIYFKKDMAEHIEKAPYILRPANLSAEAPGRGWRHYTVDRPGEPPADSADGSDEKGSAPVGMPPVRIGIISLLGQSGFGRLHGNNPYTYLSNVIDRLHKQSTITIVDFHALTTAEKYTMFHHADGMVTAVIGSGQRVMTADAHVLRGGTAAICDAGRTGSQLSVAGYDPNPEIQKFLTQRSHKSEDAWERLELQGVVLEIDEANGWVYSIDSVKVPCKTPVDKSSGDDSGDDSGEDSEE